jgi:hypothetical protein
MNNPSYPPQRRRRKSSGLEKFLLFALVLLTLMVGLIFAASRYKNFLEGERFASAPDNLPEGTQPVTQVPTSIAATASNSQIQDPQAKYFPYEYGCQRFTAGIYLSPDTYDYYVNLDRSFYYTGILPSDWEAQYYLNFLESEDDQNTLSSLIEIVANQTGQSGDELVIALTSLVQNIPYDCEKLFNLQKPDRGGYQTYYPYQTMYLQEGVCGDSSILLGKILKELGYGAAYLIYDQSDHMALGIQCPTSTATYLVDGLGYCYIETTGPSRIGVKPENLGGREFIESPLVVQISEGKTFNKMTYLADLMASEVYQYGKYILQLSTCQEISLFKSIRNSEDQLGVYVGELNQLGIELDNAETAYQQQLGIFDSMDCQGTLPQDQYHRCVNQENLVSEKVNQYNYLVDQYNRLNEEYQEFYEEYKNTYDSFSSLLEENRQGCGVVIPDDPDLEVPDQDS